MDEREETGRPGQGPRYMAPVQPWGPEWLHRHTETMPPVIFSPRYIFMSSCMQGTQRVIETAPGSVLLGLTV